MNFGGQDQMSFTLLYLIHVVPRLKYLFQRWCLLTISQRRLLDVEVHRSLSINGTIVYKPLRKAFDSWEHLQDTEGATGFYPEANDYKLHVDVQDEITNVLNIFEANLQKIETSSNIFDLNLHQHFINLSSYYRNKQ